MKQRPALNRTLIATTIASLFLAGALTTTSARDRDGVRRMEPRSGHQRSDSPRRQARLSKKNTIRHASQRRAKIRRHATPHRVVSHLPRGYRRITTGGCHYYHHNGVYYTRYHNGYRIVTAPRIARLPRHARRVRVNRTVYYVSDNVYYRPCNGYYEVCEAPRYHSSVELNAGPVRIVLTDYDHY